MIPEIPQEFKDASILMLIGVIGHFITKMAAREEQGKGANPLRYIKDHPWRILSMIVACEITLFLFHELGQLNYVTAILTGFTCQSVNDNLRKRADNRLAKIP